MINWAESCIRPLLIAYRELGPEIIDENMKIHAQEICNYEESLCIVALIGIEDPMRENVEKTVEKLRQAGINLRIMTGDSLHMGANIGKQSGILPSDFSFSTNDG